ncbi:DNA polymerase III subunit gamma/tau [Mucilaginibacter arboris]|uniref:DNA polymerase III subunit gamma/tau n=1 Tax=Mucilaginibacter arboris TaxID=2682090 RepID=A0A7K1SX95_9SPHI|nr:DNA polymerase III subunit gamma/tau [Mucilaginibacter arboris]MVN21857.1 DNA polymerase III subunit gamma/tau [Mucilaginibacter arboris]
MDNFVVSARKYRPVTFESVVGQRHITGTLKNAIKNNQLAQAFLFCGPRGVGKTTCARILAKTINCQNLQPDIEACGVCDSCRAFQNGNSFNVHELDAASNNSVDDIRNLIEQVRIPPQAGRYKIYIIDEVHMLSQAAFNAFLKTLEEPPSYAIFILATTEKHKILPTILSRCQIFDFNRIGVEDMTKHLEFIAQKEHINYEEDGLHIIAQKADGGLRDALSMFDQIVSFSGGKEITYKLVIDNLNILDYDYYFRLTDYILNENTPQSLLILNEILANGFDGYHFITGLANHFRNLLVGKDVSTLKLLEVSEGIRKKYEQQAQQISASFLVSALNIANQCDLNYKLSKNQRLQVELALIKMCHINAAFNLVKEASTASRPEDPGKKKVDLVTLPPATSNQPQEISVKIDQTLAEPEIKKADLPAVTEPELAYKPVEKPDIKPVEKPVEKSTVFIPNLNLASTSVKIPSLKDLGKTVSQEIAEDDPYLKGNDAENFDNETFLQKWNEYAAKAKAEDKGMTLLTVFNNKKPVMLQPYIFELILENKSQENSFREDKPNLMNFLRTSLRNFNIEIQTRIEEQSGSRKPYSPVEKFQFMAAKNPELAELRKRFNLEID